MAGPTAIAGLRAGERERELGGPPPRACRFCGEPLRRVILDLGMSPLCESYLLPAQLDEVEAFYPLRVFLCDACLLVQLADYVAPEAIFTEYAYFSSYSDSWLAHAERFARGMVNQLGLGPSSLVVELGSNDGYLLRHFLPAGVPVLGIEPAANVAEAAERLGVETIIRFFGQDLADALRDAGRQADLLVANNVLAQAPAINDFLAGAATILKPDGLLTIEVPHLLRLLDENQFDTIYHEHYSYFSLLAAQRILAAHGLTVVDVEQLPTHGGSLRIHARHAGPGIGPSPAVEAVLAAERRAALDRPVGYAGLQPRVEATKREILAFLIAERAAGRHVVGYGAPGKANTFLNYCGIRTDLLDYTVDRNPYKHGRYTPGTHIPIHEPGRIFETRPDVILILPWNLRAEIAAQLAPARAWGARLAVAMPHFEVLP